MLKITLLSNCQLATFRLEGRLSGPWVQELDKCCRNALATGGKPGVRLDLTGVTFIDSAGKELLTQLYRSGASLEADGCWTKTVIDGITAAADSG
jgi:anti-anti-sigma regulatory factor